MANDEKINCPKCGRLLVKSPISNDFVCQIDRLKEIFEPLYGRTLSDEEIEEINDSLVNFGKAILRINTKVD